MPPQRQHTRRHQPTPSRRCNRGHAAPRTRYAMARDGAAPRTHRIRQPACTCQVPTPGYRHILQRPPHGRSSLSLPNAGVDTPTSAPEKIAPPRLVITVWRTEWNGWNTSRRTAYQATQHTLPRAHHNCKCCLGCAQGEDELEHYHLCPIARNLAWRRLRVDASLHTPMLFTFTADELSNTSIQI